MSQTKSISTIETIKLEGQTVGLIMQDEKGFFYRPKGKSGLHSPKWDGQHFPTKAEVMASINGDKEATQATAEPVKGAKPHHAKEATPKAPKEPTKAPAAPVAKEPAKAAPATLVPTSNAVETLPATASKVRYKLVEASGAVGTHYWLYAGYEHTSGFKWNGSGGFMFLNMDAVNDFLRRNGIGGTIEVETVDVSNGSYDPNKGVTPLYKVGQASLNI